MQTLNRYTVQGSKGLLTNNHLFSTYTSLHGENRVQYIEGGKKAE